MKKDTRTAVYDENLKIEAFHFEETTRPFPNHFHDYYVIGFVEDGRRILSCKNKEYIIDKGSIVLFNPGDNHACSQKDGKAFDWRGLNIPKSAMLEASMEITGKNELPGFSQNVIYDDEITNCLRPLHEMIMNGASDFEKEESFFLLISSLIQKCGQPFERSAAECSAEIEKACEFILLHFDERISLEQICRYAGLSKSTLLRAFTKSKGITPYRYLETIRINKAKELLEKGVLPSEAAVRTGFSDQSHFTNYFKSFIGLAPGVYRDILYNKDKKGD